MVDKIIPITEPGLISAKFDRVLFLYINACLYYESFI
jgi:hypothetical protein